MVGESLGELVDELVHHLVSPWPHLCNCDCHCPQPLPTSFVGERLSVSR